MLESASQQACPFASGQQCNASSVGDVPLLSPSKPESSAAVAPLSRGVCSKQLPQSPRPTMTELRFRSKAGHIRTTMQYDQRLDQSELESALSDIVQQRLTRHQVSSLQQTAIDGRSCCRQQALDLSADDEQLLQQLLSREDVAIAVLDALNRAQVAAATAAQASGELCICRAASLYCIAYQKFYCVHLNVSLPKQCTSAMFQRAHAAQLFETLPPSADQQMVECIQWGRSGSD